MKKILFIFTIIFMSFSIISCDNKEAINEIIGLIDNLPEEITLQDEDKLNVISNKYSELSTKEQEKITNYDIYLQKQETFNKLKTEFLNQEKVNQIIKLIDELPNVNDLKLEDKNNILSVSSQYENLSSDLKLLVSNSTKLTELLQHIDKFSLVENVINLINNLPSIETLT